MARRAPGALRRPARVLSSRLRSVLVRSVLVRSVLVRFGRRRSDRGAVTVEAALALGSLAVFLAVSIGAIASVAASIRCIDAAHELVRLAARGEPDRGRQIAARLAPSGARIELVRRGDEVVAEVTAPAVRPLPLRVGGRAVAIVEPDGILP